MFISLKYEIIFNYILDQESLTPDKFFEKRLAKRPSQNTLNENFNANIFQKKLLKFLMANNISFRAAESVSFRNLLLYLRRYVREIF